MTFPKIKVGYLCHFFWYSSLVTVAEMFDWWEMFYLAICSIQWENSRWSSRRKMIKLFKILDLKLEIRMAFQLITYLLITGSYNQIKYAGYKCSSIYDIQGATAVKPVYTLIGWYRYYYLGNMVKSECNLKCKNMAGFIPKDKIYNYWAWFLMLIIIVHDS